MTFLDDTIKLVRDWDATRPRSTQAAVGWSEVGGCRAHIAYRLDGTWASDEPDNWAAVRGTAVHGLLEQILGSRPGIRTEITTSYRGIPGHADLIVDEDSVTDHKTTSLANSKRWAENHSLLRQKRIQVHGYAAGLVNDGVLPRTCTVRLLVIPVDGTFADWWAFEEPYDQALADEGVERLDEVRERMAAGESLPRDMPYQWCASYCEFFSICRSQDDPVAAETITDPERADAIAAYGEAVKAESAAKKVKEGLAPLIRGLRGTAGHWRITLGKPGEAKEAIDEDAVRADYAARGETVPLTVKPGSAPRLSVTRIKRKDASEAPPGEAVAAGQVSETGELLALPAPESGTEA